MEINANRNGEKLVLTMTGRLDTNTAPQLEAAVGDLTGVTALTLDFEGVRYVSSAGLRVLLATQKQMNKQGTLVLKNICADVREVLDITGFSDILTIE